MSQFIWPGGFAGFSQQTPAARAALNPFRNGNGGTRRRRKKAKKTARRASSTRRASKGRKLKFGSPAWRKKYNLGKKRR